MKRIVIGLVLGALMALSLATGASARTTGLGDLNQMLYPETVTTSAWSARLISLDNDFYPAANDAAFVSFSGRPY
jgi:hypothetical protein